MNITRLEGNVRVRLIDAPPPHPGEGEVVVQTAVSALCGSELHSYRTTGVDTGNSGHEAVGTVAEIGAGVTNLSIGQRVGVHAIAGCGSCSHCRAGRFTWCGSFRFYGNMHAERFLAAAASCYPLPDDISWEAGVLLTGDGFGVPYHTSRKIASPDVGTVAIFGAGPIGLGNLIIQRFLGRRVIAIDIAPYRLQTARTLGAETVDASNPDESAASAVRRLTDGVGADVCIEAAGRPETAYACFEAVRTAGTVVFNGEQGALQLSPSNHFIRRDVAAVGSWFYHFSEIGPMIELYRKGLSVTSLISHRFTAADIAKAYEEFAAGRTAKALIDWTDL